MKVPAQEYAALTSTLLLVDDIDQGLLIAETDGKMTGANIVDDPDLVEGLNLWSAVLRFVLGAFKPVLASHSSRVSCVFFRFQIWWGFSLHRLCRSGGLKPET